MTEVTLSGTHQFVLAREGVRSDHVVQVALPVLLPGQPAPSAGYPVVFVLDGGHLFGTAYEQVRLRTLTGGLPPSIVVGLSYPGDVLAQMRHRAYDFTVQTPADKYPGEIALIGSDFGGASDFLDFILADLWRALEARWPVDPSRRALVGHSLGGLFSLYALFSRPAAFQSVCALSPSIWWNDFELLDHVDAFLERAAVGIDRSSLLITVGGCEQDPPLVAPAGMSLEALAERTRMSRLIDAALELAEQLRSGEVVVDTQVFDGEDHMSVLPAALSRALSFSLGRT